MQTSKHRCRVNRPYLQAHAGCAQKRQALLGEYGVAPLQTAWEPKVDRGGPKPRASTAETGIWPGQFFGMTSGRLY